MAEVFISYQRDDRDIALMVRQALRGLGVSVWWDDNLRGGEVWADELRKAVASARAVVVLWSVRSVDSDWVHKEAAIGHGNGALLPVMIEDGCSVPVTFADIQAKRLVGWRGHEDEREFREIFAAIDRLLWRRRLLRRVLKWLLVVLAVAVLTAMVFGSSYRELEFTSERILEVCGVPSERRSGSLQERLELATKVCGPKAIPATPAPSTSVELGSVELGCPKDLGKWLTDVFPGENQWFVYPDNNSNQIGVKSFPAEMKVVRPMYRIDTDFGTRCPGEALHEVAGANVRLECPLRPEDEPAWQRDALRKWRTHAGGAVSRSIVDRIFGNRRWRVHETFRFAAVGELSKPLAIEWPITSVDTSGRKFGVGEVQTWAPGTKVRIWLAGEIPEK